VFVSGLAVLAAAWTLWLAGADRRRAQVVGLVGAGVMALAAASGMFSPATLWTAWPLGVLLLVPWSAGEPIGRLRWIAAVSTLGIWLSSTHDGGAQWGPRFVLIATPALIVLAAAALHDAVSPGTWRRVRVALVAVVVLCGVWTSRQVFLDLRGAKRYHARLVAAIDRHVPAGSYAVSNIAWIDQIAAPLHGTRTWLIAAPPAQPAAVLERLEEAGVRTITVVWSTDPVEPGPVAFAGSCYRLRDVVRVPERLIAIGQAECAR